MMGTEERARRGRMLRVSIICRRMLVHQDWKGTKDCSVGRRRYMEVAYV